VAALLVSLFYFFLIPLVSDSSDFLKTLPEYTSSVANSVATSTAGIAIQSSDFLHGFSQSLSIPSIISSLNGILSNISTGFFGTIDVVFGGVMSFFLIVIISFYLATQEDGVGKFLRIVTPLKSEPYIIDLWNRSKIKIGLWMQGQLLLSVIMAVLVFLGLALLGVRNTLLLAFIAGVFEIIPLFGAFLAAAPAVLVAFLDSGLTFSLVVVGLFVIIQQFESQLIYPLVVKKVVGVPPIISIIALIIGFKLAGFLGVILAVPLAAVLMELLNDMEKSKGRDVISS
jgi:predicted PurR-regulated permease PerM